MKEGDKVFIATIQIAVFAENHAEACDSVSACLTHNLQANNAIIDWQYLKEGNRFTSPIESNKDLIDPLEGELFN